MRRNKLLVTVTSLALAAGCVPVTAGAAEQKGMQNYIVSTAAMEKLEETYVTTDTISGQGEDLAYSATLVPGEEEMSPLFMDGSGHGKE